MKKTKRILTFLMILSLTAGMMMFAPAVSAEEAEAGGTIPVTFIEDFMGWDDASSEGLGTFGDLDNVAEKIITDDGLEVFRAFVGYAESTASKFIIGSLDEEDPLEVCLKYGGAVTYKFPFPIISYEIGGPHPDGQTSYYHQGGKIFFSKEPVNFTEDVPGEPRPISLPDWGRDPFSGTFNAEDGYYYVTIIGPRPSGDVISLANVQVTVAAEESGLIKPEPTTEPETTEAPPTEATTAAEVESTEQLTGENTSGSTTGATTGSGDTTKTEDGNDLWLYIIIAAAAVVVIIIIVIFITKKKPENK